MEQRFIRNLGALTEAQCELLRTKRIFVAGCGGIGEQAIDQLIRIGVGAVTVADGDCFDATNLNRQVLCDMEALGMSKVEMAKAHAGRVNPVLEFTAVNEYITAENAARLISGCDAVIDALDNIPARRLLAKVCSEAGIPYIYGAVSGWTAQAAVIEQGCNLLDTLYPDESAAADKSVLAFTPALCASMQTALCVMLLCGINVDSGRLYCFDLMNFDFAAISRL